MASTQTWEEFSHVVAERRFVLENPSREAFEIMQHRLGWPTPWERVEHRVRDAFIEMVSQIEDSDYFDEAVEEAMEAALEDGDQFCPECKARLVCQTCNPKEV